jgi:hypothetical protein
MLALDAWLTDEHEVIDGHGIRVAPIAQEIAERISPRFHHVGWVVHRREAGFVEDVLADDVARRPAVVMALDARRSLGTSEIGGHALDAIFMRMIHYFGAQCAGCPPGVKNSR